MSPRSVRFVLLALAFAAMPARADRVTDDARRLIEAKDAKAAYALLAPLEAKRAGEVEFDYLLGLAALDSGLLERAVFALERVLAVAPGHLQARAEIARAYARMGEIDNARREFEAVKSAQPPPEVVRTIDEYIAALTPSRGGLHVVAEASWGYDDNVNSASSREQIAFALPGFGTMVGTLSSESRARRDHFYSAVFGGTYTYALDEHWSAQGGINIQARRNRVWHDLDTDVIDTVLGLRRSGTVHTWIASLQGQNFKVNGRTFRTSNGGTLQWLMKPTPTSETGLFAQFAELHYPDQPARDAHRSTVGGMAFSHQVALPFAPAVYASAYRGKNNQREPVWRELGFDLRGLRTGGHLVPFERAKLTFSWALESRRHHGPDILFGETRADRQTDIRLAFVLSPAPDVTVGPQVQVTRNDSNLALYAYRRTVTSVALRYEF